MGCPMLLHAGMPAAALPIGDAAIVLPRAAPRLSRHRRAARRRASRSEALLAEEPQLAEQLAEDSPHCLPALSARLRQRTRDSGLLLAAYFCVAASPQAGACCACGTAGSLLYLGLLVREVERLPASYESSMLAAKQKENWLVQRLSMWALSYQHALKPRMAIPVALALGFAAYNHLVDRHLRLGYVEIGSLTVGFLAFKGALLREFLDSLQRTAQQQVEQRPHISLYPDVLEQSEEGLERFAAEQ